MSIAEHFRRPERRRPVRPAVVGSSNLDSGIGPRDVEGPARGTGDRTVSVDDLMKRARPKTSFPEQRVPSPDELAQPAADDTETKPFALPNEPTAPMPVVETATTNSEQSPFAPASRESVVRRLFSRALQRENTVMEGHETPQEEGWRQEIPFAGLLGHINVSVSDGTHVSVRQAEEDERPGLYTFSRAHGQDTPTSGSFPDDIVISRVGLGGLDIAVSHSSEDVAEGDDATEMEPTMTRVIDIVLPKTRFGRSKTVSVLNRSGSTFVADVSGDVNVGSQSGNIHLENLSGDVEGATLYGHVVADTVGSLYAQTDIGNVFVEKSGVSRLLAKQGDVQTTNVWPSRAHSAIDARNVTLGVDSDAQATTMVDLATGNLDGDTSRVTEKLSISDIAGKALVSRVDNAHVIQPKNPSYRDRARTLSVTGNSIILR